MIRKKCFLLAMAALLALTQTGRCQRALGWRIFRMADGLPESACASVSVALNGKVLVTHPRARKISELDGYRINTFPWSGTPAIRANESPAGQLWALTMEGLSEWSDGAWAAHPVIEIAAALQRGYEVSILPVQQNRILVLLPNRLVEFSANLPGGDTITTLQSADKTGIGIFTGMAAVRDGALWISGTTGLARVPGMPGVAGPELSWREEIPPASLAITNLRAPRLDGESGVVCVAESAETGKKLAVHFDGRHWTTFPAGEENLRYAWRWPNQTFGAATADMLLQWLDERAVENEEISSRQYFDVAVSAGGAVWLATSDGLLRDAPLTWRQPAVAGTPAAFVSAMARDASSALWFVSNGRLNSISNELLQEFLLPSSANRNSRSVSLAPVKDGTLLIEIGGELFQFFPGPNRFTRVQLEGLSRLSLPGSLKDGSVCVQGIPSDKTAASKLAAYDGGRFQPLSFSEPDGSIGRQISVLFVAQNGDTWLAGERGVARWHDRKWQSFDSADGTAPEGAVDFAELPDGKIWCAARDKVWAFDGRNWTIVRSGFDGINALFRASDGSMWVASNNGLIRFWQTAWIENGVEDGLPSPSVRDVCEGQEGHLWAATARGLSVFHSESDPDPPKTEIRPLTGGDSKLTEGGTINLFLGGQDRWKYTSRDRLLYSYRLDQREWTAFQPEMNAVQFQDLVAGKHYVQVRAMDRAGNIESQPAQLEFAVALPWYKETRLMGISIAALVATLFFAALALNRHRQLLRSYAEVERKVAERTRELEKANRELFQSQKMNALGTLAAGIAHDFNNILSIIKGSTQIIEDNLDNPQKVVTRLDRIKTVVEQGAGIVRAMLGFSRTSDERRELCDVNEIVGDTIKLLGDRFLRDVEVAFDPAPDLPKVAAVPDFVQQVLLNFILNAAESMTTNKHIRLATRRARALPVGPVLMPPNAEEYVLISVNDSGCGVPPENLPRIFEPFFTTKALSSRRGTGLGLSMVYELAKKMEVGLAAESVLDQGSTFTLILPVRETAANKTGAADAAHVSDKR